MTALVVVVAVVMAVLLPGNRMQIYSDRATLSSSVLGVTIDVWECIGITSKLD